MRFATIGERFLIREGVSPNEAELIVHFAGDLVAYTAYVWVVRVLEAFSRSYPHDPKTVEHYLWDILERVKEGSMQYDELLRKLRIGAAPLPTHRSVDWYRFICAAIELIYTGVPRKKILAFLDQV
jgi:hypothetical protein